MQMIENLTGITGRIVSREPHPTLQDFDMVRLYLKKAEPVKGVADLLSAYINQEISVAVRRDLLGNARAGAELRCRAKRIPEGAMCEPHPEPGNFAVNPS
ncbi:MAG TPA: hypothetical protein VFQ34_12080 [Nitrospiraceae bacterium]|nr:hypothetical protein [Nitrospiraceae bacterium]